MFDKKSGDFKAADPRHHSPVTRFPSLHVTRYDFGDLAGPGAEPYAVFPDAKTRTVDEVTVQPRPEGLEFKVREHFDRFAGTTTWLHRPQRHGQGQLRLHLFRQEMNTREAGIRFELKPACDELRWRRWSEWGIFPEDSICRTEGTAKALRTGKRGTDPENVRPTWPWSQDQTELGTADFRSIKFNIYEAALQSERRERRSRSRQRRRPCPRVPRRQRCPLARSLPLSAGPSRHQERRPASGRICR